MITLSDEKFKKENRRILKFAIKDFEVIEVRLSGFCLHDAQFFGYIGALGAYKRTSDMQIGHTPNLRSMSGKQI